MFSSGNSINQFLHLSPSNFISPPPFIGQNDNKVISLPHQNDEIILNPKKRTKRTDRHSKIYTAHGLRDRRVRLSIDISSKFFELQDILGFDKASETISWLLKSSESSIRELKKKQGINDDCLETISPISELCKEQTGASGKNTFLESKEKKINKQIRAAFDGLRRESRTRARARARERTREKITRSKKINDLNPSISDYLNCSISIQSHYNLVNEIDVCGGIVSENGSPSNPEFENHLIAHKDWGKNSFAGMKDLLAKHSVTRRTSIAYEVGGGPSVDKKSERASSSKSLKEKTSMAERRSIQETQRAAKDAAKADGASGSGVVGAKPNKSVKAAPSQKADNSSIAVPEKKAVIVP